MSGASPASTRTPIVGLELLRAFVLDRDAGGFSSKSRSDSSNFTWSASTKGPIMLTVVPFILPL